MTDASPEPNRSEDAPHLAALVRMSGDFLLALRIAAARLGGARSMSLPALLAALADEDRRLAQPGATSAIVDPRS